MNTEPMPAEVEVSSNPLLAASTVEQRNRWWCILNCFGWPNDLPVTRPRDWHKMDTDAKRKDPVAMAVWRWINARTTDEGRLKYWNTVLLPSRHAANNDSTSLGTDNT